MGINNLKIELLARNTNCLIGDLPFIYIGLLVGALISRIFHWSTLISKFQAKLSKWKASTVSFGGRLTLCKYVLGSLGAFLFSLYKAPIKVVNSLEILRRHFFWDRQTQKTKISWISWENVLSKQEDKGINIGNL